MSELVSSQNEEDSTKKTSLFIKFHILALGLVLVFISVYLLQFFLNMQHPPELNLPPELQPKWTEDESLLATMAFIGNIGVIIGAIVLLGGMFITLYGVSIQIRKRVPRKFEGTFFESLLSTMQSEKNFVLMVLVTLVFGILWFFNLLTYPPSGPLYFLREPYLEFYFPDVPKENLSSLSTYGLFAVIQDTAILLIYLYIIYVRVRPGEQFGEEFVNFVLQRTLFLIVLMVSSLYHAIGHLPFELYGRGKWGTGFSSIEAWIAFDKIAHLLASAALTMLIVAVLSNQIQLRGKGSSIFTLIVGVSFMISLGVFWEIYEWLMNALFDLGHFLDEILDAPKDLVWNVIGAILGALFAYYDIRRNKIKSNTQHTSIEI